MSLIRQASATLALLILAGCTSTSPETPVETLGYAAPARLSVCHGYGCTFKTRLELGARDGARFKAIMARGKASPAAERKAISRAVRYFEDRSYQVTGVRDEPSAKLGASRIRGQMDCIDEATNTRALLRYLAKRGMLKHHKVERNASRGHFIDGRYPHWTAVIRDPKGVTWAVDSYYAPMGGAPDVIPMSEWKPRGYLSSGALDS